MWIFLKFRIRSPKKELKLSKLNSNQKNYTFTVRTRCYRDIYPRKHSSFLGYVELMFFFLHYRNQSTPLKENQHGRRECSQLFIISSGAHVILVILDRPRRARTQEAYLQKIHLSWSRLGSALRHAERAIGRVDA